MIVSCSTDRGRKKSFQDLISIRGIHKKIGHRFRFDKLGKEANGCLKAT